MYVRKIKASEFATKQNTERSLFCLLPKLERDNRVAVVADVKFVAIPLSVLLLLLVVSYFDVILFCVCNASRYFFTSRVFVLAFCFLEEERFFHLPRKAKCRCRSGFEKGGVTLEDGATQVTLSRASANNFGGWACSCFRVRKQEPQNHLHVCSLRMRDRLVYKYGSAANEPNWFSQNCDSGSFRVFLERIRMTMPRNFLIDLAWYVNN